MAKPVKLESALERELTARVEAKGGICWKMQRPGRRGFPDRLVIFPGGLIYFVETKRGSRGRFSSHQILCIRTLSELGAEVAIVKKSEDIDDLFSRIIFRK